ncbi:unnamed protein product [Penicillium salamii]|uniref:Uncharacterized protein n=1 Tax=Penicillium salamii TaxID=1612424 RepID=A0A9W4JE13_9EURO|nr:unnamed protein product [Penicillium salamii]CAG8074183.1 unnamed protein product [Penicillium salamii]CAG8121764.1 unnamed protein product [Penicillium salamii]CAG8134834.1 unnamed protein product [Penicillium salamii]CAG8301804.1 unnamed protein product [Penicillium salamii]
MLLLPKSPSPSQTQLEDQSQHNQASNDGTKSTPIFPTHSDSTSSFSWPPKPFLLLLDEADTLVFIDPAPESVRAGLSQSTSVAPHNIHSERLLATDSTYFRRLFTPAYQAKVRKQRGMPDNLPVGIKYVLDLTPPLLDDEALILLTELSCPSSVREWASKKRLWNLPRSCVGGLDETEAVASGWSQETHQFEEYCDHCSIEHGSLESSDAIDPRIKDVNSKQLPLEYSSQRHREGIEHILHVLMGLNPTLDTPCKLWTFFGLAKFFDVATVPAVSGHIISWFYELNNIRFMEVHPEVVYRVACGTKSPRLCREAFVALVADAALLYLLRMTGFTPVKCMTKLTKNPAYDVLDDSELQRIEYASKSFGDFVLRCFSGLAGSKMAWLRHVVPFQTLNRHLALHPEDSGIVNPIINTFKDYIRDRIYGAFFNGRDTNRALHADPSGEKFSDLYYRYLSRESPDNKFLLQRLIGRDFWQSLLWLDLSKESTSRANSHTTIAAICDECLAFAGDKDATIRHVSNDEVLEACLVFNQLSLERLQLRYTQESEAVRLAGERRVMEMTINIRQGQPDTEEGPPSYDGPVWNPTPASAPSPLATATAPRPPNIPDYLFDIEVFRSDASEFIGHYANAMLKSDSTTTSDKITDTLSCLTNNEYQYLPLWADGNDDGTGGVFSDLVVPTTEPFDFPGPGAEMYTGNATSSGSLIKVDHPSPASTIRAASRHATYDHCSDMTSFDSCALTQGSECPEYPTEVQPLTPSRGFQYGQFEYEASMDLEPAMEDESETQTDSALVDMELTSDADLLGDIEMGHIDQDMVDFELL